MKKTQLTEIIKTIKNTLFSYISVILFVMLGVGLFCGLGWSGKTEENSIDKYFNEYCFRDVEIIFPYGATDKDVEDIKKIEDVSTAEGLYEAFTFFELNGNRFHAKIPMITSFTDKFSYIEGNLPNNNGEIAVTKTWGKNNGIKLGDEITLSNDGNGIKYFTNDKFTVTAFVESPTFMSIYPVTIGVALDTFTQLDCVMFLHRDAFNGDVFGGYGSVLVTSDSLRNFVSSTKEYDSKCEELKNKILSSVEPSKNVVGLTRAANAGFSGAKTTFGMYDKLRYTMAALFVVIGTLVSYTSVSRIVFEQKVLIGTKKALGLKMSEIKAGYVIYALSAVIIGSVLGVLFARFGIETVFLSVMTKNFTFNKCVYYFSVSESLIAFVVEAVLILSSALLACGFVLRTGTVSLLNGADEKIYKPKFYEKTRFWNKLSLVTKSIINNFFKDKRRVVATLVSILGCASLVVCGLTFNNGLTGALDKQFNKIQSFDTLVYYDQSVDGCDQNISAKLNDKELNYSKVFHTIGKTQYKDVISITMLFVADDIDGLFNIYDMQGIKQELGDKIWISCAFALKNGIGVGDKVTFISEDGKSQELEIGGVYEFYLIRCQILMSQKTFSRIFGYEIGQNAFMINRKNFTAKDIDGEVKGINGFVQTEDFLKTSNDTYATIKSTGFAISAIYVVLSVVLALLVLLNLLIMFIEEKKRELIVMIINGFNLKTVKKYIYSDTMLLSVIGVILGVILGTVMGNLSLKALSTEVCHFLYGIHPFACLMGVAVTAVIIVVMSVIALRRIGKFKLTDIND